MQVFVILFCIPNLIHLFLILYLIVLFTLFFILNFLFLTANQESVGGITAAARLQDIADWLQVPAAGLKAFGEEVRPVKLRTVVKGYAPTKTDFLFERRLNDYVYGVIAEHSKSKPSLIFCRSA